MKGQGIPYPAVVHCSLIPRPSKWIVALVQNGETLSNFYLHTSKTHWRVCGCETSHKSTCVCTDGISITRPDSLLSYVITYFTEMRSADKHTHTKSAFNHQIIIVNHRYILYPHTRGMCTSQYCAFLWVPLTRTTSPTGAHVWKTVTVSAWGYTKSHTKMNCKHITSSSSSSSS